MTFPPPGYCEVVMKEQEWVSQGDALHFANHAVRMCPGRPGRMSADLNCLAAGQMASCAFWGARRPPGSSLSAQCSPSAHPVLAQCSPSARQCSFSAHQCSSVLTQCLPSAHQCFPSAHPVLAQCSLTQCSPSACQCSTQALPPSPPFADKAAETQRPGPCPGPPAECTVGLFSLPSLFPAPNFSPCGVTGWCDTAANVLGFPFTLETARGLPRLLTAATRGGSGQAPGAPPQP